MQFSCQFRIFYLLHFALSYLACNVIYLANVDTESLTGPQAISRAVQQTFSKGTRLDTTVATFKVSNDGITITDTNHRLVGSSSLPSC